MTTQTILRPHLTRQHSELRPWPTLDSRDHIRKSEYPEYEQFFSEPVPDLLPSSMERCKLAYSVPETAVSITLSAHPEVQPMATQGGNKLSNTAARQDSKLRLHLRRSLSRRETPLLLLLLFSVVFALRY